MTGSQLAQPLFPGAPMGYFEAFQGFDVAVSSIPAESKSMFVSIFWSNFVGSNSSLVAPLTIEEESTIGAGSVISKSVKKKYFSTFNKRIFKSRYKIDYI